MVGGRHKPGEERDVGTSSPTYLASSVLHVFSVAVQFDRDVAQFDIVKAYMLAAPSHLHCVCYPPGFGEYLARSEGAEQFDTIYDPYHDTSAFLRRVNKHCYGPADAGRMWYGTLAGFLHETLGFKVSQIDRCVFARHNA